MKCIVIILFLLLSSNLFAGVGLNAKFGGGVAMDDGPFMIVGVLSYGGELVIFSDIMLCGSIGFDAWLFRGVVTMWGPTKFSMYNNSIIVTLGVAFPRKKPVASIRGGTGLVTWWTESSSYEGTSRSNTETMSSGDFFGVFDLYIPMDRQFDILFQGKFAHQTCNYETGRLDNWNTFSGRLGFQVRL